MAEIPLREVPEPTGQGIRVDAIYDAWLEFTPLGVFPVACPCGQKHLVEATETVSFKLEE